MPEISLSEIASFNGRPADRRALFVAFRRRDGATTR
jgi:hypothetical protein